MKYLITAMLAVLLPALTTAAATHGADASKTGTLTIRIEGLHGSAPVHFSLWNSASGFLHSKPLRSAKKAVSDGRAVWTIENVKYGDYAVTAWQDTNGDGKLEANNFGAPTEPVGFSNHAHGHFGPPTYQDAKITVGKPATTAPISLACPMGCASR